LAIKGERVGRFALQRRLGAVMEGELWKARDDAGHVAALKLFYSAEWASVLQATGLPEIPHHVNLCALMDGDLAGSPPWVATELHEGATLAEILASTRYVPLAAAIPTIIQTVRGLAALHKAGLAHLDLRPSNVLLDERGCVRLREVQTPGYRREVLRRLFDRARPLAAEGVEEMKQYAPPEERRGEVSGAAADVYALGLLIYEMLVGERPEGFELRLPSQRDKRIPKVIDEIVLGSLERSVRARLPDAMAIEPKLLEGLEKTGFHVFPKGDPVTWVKLTPWRDAGKPVGEETGRFTSIFRKLAGRKE